MTDENIVSSGIHPTGRRFDANTFAPKIMSWLGYWPLYLICLVFSAITAFLYLYFTTPTYTISATLSQKAFPFLSNISASDDWRDRVQSTLLPVIGDLNLDVQYFNKKAFASEELYKNSPIEFKFMSSGVPENHEFNVSITDKDYYVLKTSDSNRKYAFGKVYSNGTGSWSISKLASFDNHIGHTFTIKVEDPQTVATTLVSKLSVAPAEDDQSLIQFAIKDKVLERGEAIISRLIVQLNLNLEREKVIESSIDLKLLDQRLQTFGIKVDSLQTELNSLGSDERDLLLSKTSKNYLEVARSNARALNEVKFKLLVLSALENHVSYEDLNSPPPTSASGFSDPVLEELVHRLIVLQSQKQQLSETYAKNDKIFMNLQHKVVDTRNDIKEGLLVSKSALLKRKADLESFANRSEVILDRLPSSERRVVDLKRKQIAYENEYAFLSKRKEEAALKRATNIYVRESPDTTYQVDVNRDKVYTWALLLGLLVPSAFIAGRNALSSRNYRYIP